MNQATATDLALEENSISINESFQADVESLSNCIADCVRSTDCYLADPINRGNVGRFRISRITAGLFVLIVTVTLILNISLLNAGATNVQLMICNAGMMILHLLTSICIASDLARGKTHFLSERAHLSRQFQELTENLKDMLRERHKWIESLNRCKWSMDAERLKAQLTTHELQTAEDKLLSAKSLLAEKQTELNAIESKQAMTTAELQKSVKEHTATDAELKKMQADCNALKITKTQLAAEIQAAEAIRTSNAAELEQIEHQIEHQIQSLSAARAKEERELESLQSEMQAENAKFAAQKSHQAESIADFELQIDQLKLEQERLDAAVQESTQIDGELQAAIGQSQTEFDAVRTERTQEIAQFRETIASCETTLLTKQAEVENISATIAALTATKIQIEADLARARGVLNEINAKAEYEQFCNVQRINETISLELKQTQNREAVAQTEAELECIQQQLIESAANLNAMRSEQLKLEMQIANLLTQADKLDCLAVATSASHAYVQTQQQAVLSTSLTELENQKAAIEKSLQEIRSQVESEALAAEKTWQKRFEAEKSVSDAECRVEMLTAKAENLAELVQARSAELFAFKQELMQLRVEVRDLEATKLEIQQVDQELEGLKLQLTNYRLSIHEIKTQITDCEAKLQSQRLAGDAAQQQVTDLDSQLELALDQYQSLTQSLATLVLEHDQTVAAVSSLSLQKAELESTVREILDAKQLAARQCEELRDQARLQRELIDQLETKRTAIESELEVAAQQLLEVNNVAAGQVDELRDQANIQSEQIRQLNAEKTAIQCEVNERTATLQILLAQSSQIECETERLQQLIAQRDAMEDECATITATLESLEHHKSMAADKLELQEHSVKTTESQIIAMRDAIKSLQSQQVEAESAYAQAQQDLASTLQLQQVATVEHETALQQTALIQELITEMQVQFNSLGIQKLDATETLAHTIDEVNDAQSVAKQWATYVDSLKSEVESQKKIKVELQSSVDALQTSESQAMQKLERASNEVASLLEQQVSLTASNKAMEVEIRTTQLALDEAVMQRTDAQHELIDARNVLENLEIKASDANAELNRVEEAVNAAIQSQATLDSQIIDRQAQLERTASDHEDHLSRVRDLVEEQAFLESSLAEINRRIVASESEIVRLESHESQLEQDLQQQQASQEIAAELQATIEAEIAQLNTEIAELRSTKLELVKVEASCLERKEALRTLCAGALAEQARLSDLTEQVTAAQRALDNLLGQHASTEEMFLRLEQQYYAVQQLLAMAADELQTTIASNDSVTKLKNNLDSELQSLTEQKAMLEEQTQLLSEQASVKSNDLEVAEEQVVAAEGKALELWSTISELQQLSADLDELLASKRDAVSQANAEMVKFDEMRESILSQHQAMEVAVAALVFQSQEGQHAKHELEQEISQLSAEVERLKIEVAEAQTSLQLVTEKFATASNLETQFDSREKLATSDDIVVAIPNLETATLTSLAEELSNEVETVESSEIAVDASQENDVWSTLGELARMGEVLRVNSANLGELESSSRLIPLREATATTLAAKPKLDEWETVFSTSTTKRRV